MLSDKTVLITGGTGPGHGLPPKRLDDLIGRTLARPVRAKTATCEEDFAD